MKRQAADWEKRQLFDVQNQTFIAGTEHSLPFIRYPRLSWKMVLFPLISGQCQSLT